MFPRKPTLLSVLIIFVGFNQILAQESNEEGTVELPLSSYNQMLQTVQIASRPHATPAPYALSSGTMTVDISATKSAYHATVTTTFTARIFEDEWVLVPVLPLGTAVESATVDGQVVALVQHPGGLMWNTNKKGQHSLNLTYRQPVQSVNDNSSLTIPSPLLPAIQLRLRLNKANQDIQIMPAISRTTKFDPHMTEVNASIPTTSTIQVHWQNPGGRQYRFTQAKYIAEQEGNQLKIRGEIYLHLNDKQSLDLPLLPDSVTLNKVTVDGRAALVDVVDGKFTAEIKGVGDHRVDLVYQVLIRSDQDPPNIEIALVEVPISEIKLTLNGHKDIKSNPNTTLAGTFEKDKTSVTLFTPMSNVAAFSWTEAVPENLTQEFRANAHAVHAVHVDEGVLMINAWLDIEVTRGESSTLDILLPRETLINDVVGSQPSVSEWTLMESNDPKKIKLRVFLNRKLSDRGSLKLIYELPLSENDQVNVPLVQVLGMNRQRGMIALLSNRVSAMTPTVETNLSAVGENQIPAAIRESIEMVIAHTYKYTQETPVLSVELAEPEWVQAKFNISADTLVSLGDVSLHGSSSIDCHIKSGQVESLKFKLPKEATLLHLSAPSLRDYKTELNETDLLVTLTFTQALKGQIRIDMDYEQITDNQQHLLIPSPICLNADIQQGRVAVEALSAVEVQTSKMVNLTALDLHELPQQLILKTTNPILAAYKYVRVVPATQLVLSVKRHQQLDVHSASIDQCHYTTLVTSDGLSVNHAVFKMRNRSEQFLRLAIPKELEIWSVFVADQAVKPAIIESNATAGSENELLIKIIHSSNPFDIDIVYALPIDKLDRLGLISEKLPQPDINVTQTYWDLYLPSQMRYGRVDSNMELSQEARILHEQDMHKALNATFAQNTDALQLNVPRTGVHFQLHKLYANRAEKAPYFQVTYLTGTGSGTSQILNLLAIITLWLTITGRFNIRSRPIHISTITACILYLCLTILVLKVRLAPALGLAAILAIFTLLRRFEIKLPWLNRSKWHS